MAKLQDNRTPPQSLESELALIGAAFDPLNTSESAHFDLADLRSIISPEMFYAAPDHAAIWQGVIDADDAGDPITIASVLPRLNGKSYAEWREDIQDCLAASDPANAKYHASAILAAAEKRDGIRILQRYAERLGDPLVESAGELFEELQDEIRKIGAGAGRVGLVSETYADVLDEKMEWLWHDRFPLGMLSLIVGYGDQGKSLLSLDMAARISRGQAWPDRRGEQIPIGRTIHLACEDHASKTIGPRLTEARAIRERITRIKGTQRGDDVVPFDLETDLRHLRKLIDKHADTRMVCIDPLSAYLGKSCDSWKDDQVRRVLGPLATLAEETNVAVIGLAHFNKNTASATSVMRVLGSVAFVNAARAVWVVWPDNDDPSRKLLLRSKGNLSEPLWGLAYRIVGNPETRQPHLEWEDAQVSMSADQAMAPLKPPTATEEAATWLRELLAEGPKPQTEIKLAAEMDGHSWSTVKRAKDRVGVDSKPVREGDKVKSWAWSLRSS